MLYVVAFLCPPLAVLLTGRFFTAIVVLLLWPLLFPAALIAMLVVSGHYEDKRTGKLLKAGKHQHKAMIREMRDLHDSTTAQNRALYEASMRQALAAERQAAALERALGSQQPPAPKPLPSAEPEADAIDVEYSEPKPTARERFEIFLERTKVAYEALPEWGQPVVWGLAAATPVVLVMVAVKMVR